MYCRPNNLVVALHNAAVSSVVRVKCGSMKPYWNDELDRFKADSIFGTMFGLVQVDLHLAYCTR